MAQSACGAGKLTVMKNGLPDGFRRASIALSAIHASSVCSVGTSCAADPRVRWPVAVVHGVCGPHGFGWIDGPSDPTGRSGRAGGAFADLLTESSLDRSVPDPVHRRALGSSGRDAICRTAGQRTRRQATPARLSADLDPAPRYCGRGSLVDAVLMRIQAGHQ